VFSQVLSVPFLYPFFGSEGLSPVRSRSYDKCKMTQ
jgi:hypothetical protein